MGHWQGFTAIYAHGGWDMPHDPIGCIRSAAMFNVVPIATTTETMIHIGLRAILRSSIASSRLCNCK
eukprot:6209248-Pleurochrysis_carterae.AAC.2